MPNVNDQVNYADPLASAQMAFWIASNIQDEMPGRQVLATGMLFKLFCDEMNLPITDVLAKIGSVLLDTDHHHHRQVAALRQLIREEYLK